MGIRNRISEIEALRERGHSHLSIAEVFVQSLSLEWDNGNGPLSNAGGFIIIRLVTVIEFATRAWITMLVDHGEPFVSNAASLVQVSGLKFDYAITRALHGKQITLGELVAHSVSTNRISDVAGAISAVLGTDMFHEIAGTTDRVRHEIFGEPSAPIIQDLEAMRSNLAKVFDIRHIVVHELTKETPYVRDDIQDFIEAVRVFIKATDGAISKRLYGNYPITQADMNREAKNKSDQVESELQDLLARLDPSKHDQELWRTQDAWLVYRKLHAEYSSHINDPFPGSIAPTIYWSEIANVTRERIKQLGPYLRLFENGN